MEKLLKKNTCFHFIISNIIYNNKMKNNHFKKYFPRKSILIRNFHTAH